MWIRLDLGQYGDQLTKTTDPWSHKETDDGISHVLWTTTCKEEEDWSPERVVPNERLSYARCLVHDMLGRCSMVLFAARLGHLGQDEDTSNVNPELVEEIKKVVSRHGPQYGKGRGAKQMHHTVRQSFGKQNGCMAGVFAGFDDDLSDALAVCSYSDACFVRTVTNGSRGHCFTCDSGCFSGRPGLAGQRHSRGVCK